MDRDGVGKTVSVDLIAEIGSAHMGDKGRALALIAAAAESGATTVKAQLFEPDGLWRHDDPRHAAVAPLCLPEAWLPDLKTACERAGVEFLCTPFSVRAVRVLAGLGVARMKVASGDLTYMPLLEAVGRTGLPVLLSTGFATVFEVHEALMALHGRQVSPQALWTGGPTRADIALLHCTGAYPELPACANLPRLDRLRRLFPHFRLGVSSHWREWWLDIAAVARGAMIIEKHFDLADGAGPEAGHSLLPDEFRTFARAVHDATAALIEISEGNFSEADAYARQHYRRDPSDWLRPIRYPDG